MICSTCGKPFDARADARFCSGKCRVAHHRGATIPLAMRRLPRWVRYSAKKAPLTTTGWPASSTNPSTWTTYEAARADDHGIGFGFVLNGDGIAAIDLDHCLTDGVLEPWAREIVDACEATYIEVSPSGTGLHIFGRGTVGQGRRMNGIEVYDRGRYFTVTGRRFEGAPKRLGNLSGVIASLT